MPGKWNLGGGCKDPDPARMPLLRGEHEGSLGEIELTRDLLHLPVRQAVRLGQYGELIATEAGVGEDVTDVIAIRHPFLRRLPPLLQRHPEALTDTGIAWPPWARLAQLAVRDPLRPGQELAQRTQERV
jgi:hypothetical protein